MSLALYPSRVRSNEVLGVTPSLSFKTNAPQPSQRPVVITASNDPRPNRWPHLMQISPAFLKAHGSAPKMEATAQAKKAKATHILAPSLGVGQRSGLPKTFGSEM